MPLRLRDSGLILSYKSLCSCSCWWQASHTELLVLIIDLPSTFLDFSYNLCGSKQLRNITIQMNRRNILTHSRTAVRVVLFSAVGTATVAAIGFVGTHLYLESEDPTPPEWPRKMSFAYRAAKFNSKYLDQQEAARSGLLAAMSLAQNVENTNQPDQTTARPDAKPENVGARDALAVPESRYAKALILLGQVERKLGLLEEAVEHFSKALEDRPALDRNQVSLAARNLGELQERFGSISDAQISLDLAMTSILPQHEPGSTAKLSGSLKYSPELVDGAKALALLHARKGKLKDALASLLSILQFQRQHPSIASGSCQVAATMSNIAEIVWALGDEAECTRWTTDAVAICENDKNKNDKYCLECAGINHNMLGLLSQKQGNTQEARERFGRALMCAERAGDENGLHEYLENLEACR